MTAGDERDGTPEFDGGDDAGSGSEKPWWNEMMKEITLTGMATFFMTEDSIRRYLRDKKLPKELISLLLESASKKKEDLYAKFAGEFGKVLAKIDVSQEIARFMETHKIHLEAKVSFEPKTPRASVEARNPGKGEPS